MWEEKFLNAIQIISELVFLRDIKADYGMAHPPTLKKAVISGTQILEGPWIPQLIFVSKLS